MHNNTELSGVPVQNGEAKLRTMERFCLLCVYAAPVPVEWKPCDRKWTGEGRESASGAVETSPRVKTEAPQTRFQAVVNHNEASIRKRKLALCSDGGGGSLSPCVPAPEGQPDPDPGGEGDPGGVGPVPAALCPLHALHPGGAGRVRHLLLRAPALPPTHEGEAGQPGN